MDDALTERFPVCICCMQPRGQARLDMFLVGRIVLVLNRCHRCAARDPEARHLLARLAEREEQPHTGAGDFCSR